MNQDSSLLIASFNGALALGRLALVLLLIAGLALNVHGAVVAALIASGLAYLSQVLDATHMLQGKGLGPSKIALACWPGVLLCWLVGLAQLF